MQLFTYMDDDVYRYCITHAKENPFRHYLEFLEKLHELSETEETLCSGLGKDFLTLIETTDMQKVYKMPILYSFFNHGNVRLAVKDDEVLAAWKDFFNTGKNWKDFAADITYDEYKSITDKQHLRKAKSMPIKYLKASGKGVFVEKDGFALAIRDDLKDIVKNDAFIKHMHDILEYRTIEYYRRRYLERI